MSDSYEINGNRTFLNESTRYINFDNDLNEIFDREHTVLQQDIQKIYELQEGIGDILGGAWDTVKSGFQNIKDKISAAVEKFYERFIKGTIQKLWEYAMKGITIFLDVLGLDIDGDVKFKTPAW